MFENKIKITAPFWQQYIKLVREEMLPFQWDVLNDKADIKIEKERDADYIPSEKSHAIENFKIAAGITQGHHYGMVFQDSDVYKWLEAAAYALHQHYDEDLRKIADGVVDLLAQAQEEDSYLNTYFTIEAPDRKYKRLYQSHELYCAGHFIEAAVGYFNVTGNKKILDIAYKLADNIDRHFGSEEGKIHGYDGHEEIELALLRLYELSHDEKYKKLAHFFLYERGKNPNFFKEQQKDDPSTKVLIEGMDGFKPSYYQNHKPILESCSQASIANSLMDMATLGLSVQKKQGYFIAYGGKCQFQRSYFGNITIARRFGLKDIHAEVIYEGDNFVYHIEDGNKVLDKHEQSITNIDNDKIIGAYAVVIMQDGTKMLEVMNMKQIKQSWQQGYGYKEGSGTHSKFADQMAKKTVINRALKQIINTHGDVFVQEADERTEDVDRMEQVEADVAYEIESGANKEEFIVEEPQAIEEKPAPKNSVIK